MADNTKIEWSDATVNAVNGCTVYSLGCTNCYAMRSGGRNLPGHPATGLTQPSKAGHVWTGEVRFSETQMLKPLSWKRPRKIFWNAHGDLFHENVPDEWIDRCFAVMALTPQHIHQVLTKRSARMREYVCAKAGWHIGRDGVRRLGHRNDRGLIQATARCTTAHSPAALENAAKWPLANVHLGVSVEDQTRADERIPDLLATPAAVRWISAEPLLGPLDLRNMRENLFPISAHVMFDALEGTAAVHSEHDIEPSPIERLGSKIDWVVVGGESGPGARPMNNAWAQSIVDQCQAAGVAVFVKQLSSGGARAIKDIEAFPEGLRVREYPA